MGAIQKLADYFHVKKSYIIGEDDDNTPHIPGLIPKEEFPMQRKPILGDIAAGQPIAALREYDDYIDVPDIGERYDALIRVKGDSMEPHYNEGDLVMIRYQDDVDDGQTAAVCLDDGVTLKKVYHIPHGVQLISENRKYAPMIYTDRDVDSIHLVGLAVGFVRWED